MPRRKRTGEQALRLDSGDYALQERTFCDLPGSVDRALRTCRQPAGATSYSIRSSAWHDGASSTATRPPIHWLRTKSRIRSAPARPPAPTAPTPSSDKNIQLCDSGINGEFHRAACGFCGSRSIVKLPKVLRRNRDQLQIPAALQAGSLIRDPEAIFYRPHCDIKFSAIVKKNSVISMRHDVLPFVDDEPSCGSNNLRASPCCRYLVLSRLYNWQRQWA